MGTRQINRIGEFLVSYGVLSEEQVEQILLAQRESGRPFGELAERMFSIRTEDIEKAWIEQYISYGTSVDLNSQQIDVEVLRVLNRRQAWQFRILPLRRDDDGLVAATCPDRLPRAVNFAWRRMHDPVFFLIAQRPQLEQFLMEHYPWAAMDREERLAAIA